MNAFVRTTVNKQGETEHHVPFFTPANSGSSEGLLRVTNTGESSADVTIAGRDDAGTATTTEDQVVLTLPAGATRTLDRAGARVRGRGLHGSSGRGRRQLATHRHDVRWFRSGNELESQRRRADQSLILHEELSASRLPAAARARSSSPAAIRG